jgi:hypothetical protein
MQRTPVATGQKPTAKTVKSEGCGHRQEQETEQFRRDVGTRDQTHGVDHLNKKWKYSRVT